jgi:hypothetical protein
MDECDLPSNGITFVQRFVELLFDSAEDMSLHSLLNTESELTLQMTIPSNTDIIHYFIVD